MNDHLLRANQLIQLQRFEAAENELIKSLALDPENFLAYASLAICCASRGDIASAEEAVDRAISLAPDVAYPFYVQAMVCLEKSEFQDALDSIRIAIRLAADDANNYWLRGCILSEMQRHDKAVANAAKGLTFDPVHLGCLRLLAGSLQALGHVKEARSVASRLLTHSPEDAQGHLVLGRLALSNQDSRTAFAHFRQAIRSNPNDDNARLGLIEALLAQRSFMARLLKYRSELESSMSRSAIASQRIKDKTLSREEKQKAERQQLTSSQEDQAIFGRLFISLVAVPLCNFFFQFSSDGRLLLTVRERTYATCATLYICWWFAILATSIIRLSDPIFAQCLFAALLFPSLPLVCSCRGWYAVPAGLIFSTALVLTSLIPWTYKSGFRTDATWEPHVEGWTMAAPFISGFACFVLMMFSFWRSASVNYRPLAK